MPLTLGNRLNILLLKDKFYRGREFDSFERFKTELDAYIIHWNTG